MRKKLINIVLISCLTALVIGLATLYAFRLQGRQRSLNLRVPTSEVVELRIRAGGTAVRLFRQADEWRLSHPALSNPVPADELAVETLLDDLRHWEVKTLVSVQALDTAAQADTETASVPVSGRLRVYTRGGWGGLFGPRKVWDGRYIRTERALYLRDSRRLYSQLYDPRRAGEGGEVALAADCTTALRHWRDRWICHYYYYDIARAEWQEADAHFVYTADGRAGEGADTGAETAAAGHETATTAAAREQALSAFRAVSFDRYAIPADSLILRQAFAQPAHLRFSVFSKDGDSTFLSAYHILNAQGQADWFRLCGRLEKHGPQTPAPQTDTVFLSYQTLDRLKAAFSAMADR